MADVMLVGVAALDFVFSVDAFPEKAMKYRAEGAEIIVGGGAANAALAVSRLGGTAHLGARLGDDRIADIFLSLLAPEGVRTDLVQRSPGARSSFSSIYIDPEGERQIMNFRGSDLVGDTGWIGNTPDVQAVMTDTRWGAGAIRVLELASERGVPGVVDAEAPMDRKMLSPASHVAFSLQGLMSFAEGGTLDEALLEADGLLPGWVCVTDGADGAYHVEDGAVVNTPGFAVDAKDTLGAGDVWHGAFTLALAEGRKESEAIRFANAAAAIKCMTFGGLKGCPDRDAVERFLKEQAR